MIGFDNERGRVLEYEQKLVPNSNSCQRFSPHRTSVLNVSSATIYVGKVHLRKELGLERATQNCLFHFLLANCTWKQHLSGCCCLMCLLNYENLRLFMHLVWKLNLVSLITALHYSDEGYLTKLLCWYVCIWPTEIKLLQSILVITDNDGTVTCVLLPLPNFSSSGTIMRVSK